MTRKEHLAIKKMKPSEAIADWAIFCKNVNWNSANAIIETVKRYGYRGIIAQTVADAALLIVVKDEFSWRKQPIRRRDGR